MVFSSLFWSEGKEEDLFGVDPSVAIVVIMADHSPPAHMVRRVVVGQAAAATAILHLSFLFLPAVTSGRHAACLTLGRITT